NPDEDTPRLVYADWLQEHAATDADRARAEFIRTQCAGAPMCDSDPRREALTNRAVELEEKHKAAWLAPLTGKTLDDVIFSRGFAWWLDISAAAVAKLRFPWHREPVLVVWVKGSSKKLVAAVPFLAGVSNLGLRQDEYDDSRAGNKVAAAVAAEAGL